MNTLIRPADDVYFNELDARFRTVRRFLPTLIEQIHFAANVAGEPLVAALDWLGTNLACRKPAKDAPQAIVSKAWERHVQRTDGSIDLHAYAFCVLEA
ncbi:hypothetical protein LBW46_26485, partial [Ralstonia solanacearum]|uniref:hypothetical protein n=1 Tax=Ralstonia solanacearum TaxID=305 RepID=UPI0023055B1B